MSLEDAWYIAAASKDLGETPLARRILGRPIVLFRDAARRAVALEDRCPHRNVPLSLGAVTGGTLRCAYHGWRFDGAGRCVEAPCAATGEAIPECAVPRFAVAERDGSVWVRPGNGPADPPGWPLAGEPGYRGFELVTTIRCPMLHVLTNFVDCGHTGFVHAGLFRGAPQREVRAAIEETPTGVRIETVGESDPASPLSRLLVRKGQTIRHTDELIVPHTVRVDYRFGSRHIATVSICTPEDDATTIVRTRVAIHFTPFSALLIAPMKALTRKILEQDRVILEGQAANLARFGGERFVSMEADAPTAWVTRAIRRFESGSAPDGEQRHKDVRYTL